jgi:NAD(P)H dehydrogenase (quinone)
MKQSILWVVSFLLIISVGYAEENTCRVLVVYHSVTGNTQLMAEAVAEGARRVEGVEVKLRTVDEATTADVLEADAILVGSPVYNANVVPEVQQFINNWPFKDTPLKNKLGAAFVTAGGISAGEEITMLSILHSMLIYEMIVVGGAGWQSAFGASAIVEEKPFDQAGESRPIAEHFLDKGRNLGERVAGLAKKFKTVEASAP